MAQGSTPHTLECMARMLVEASLPQPHSVAVEALVVLVVALDGALVVGPVVVTAIDAAMVLGAAVDGQGGGDVAGTPRIGPAVARVRR